MAGNDPDLSGDDGRSPTVAAGVDSDVPRPRRTNRWMWLAAVLALFVIALSGFVIYRFLTDEPTPSADVAVPTFVGRSFDEARAIADAVGLQLVPTGQPSDQPISIVLTQDPQSGTMVARGSSVAVTIATGTETVTIPDLRGRSEAEALALLSRAGLVAGLRELILDTVVPAGSIVSQDPQPGTRAPRGTPVSYTVSAGPAASASTGPGATLTPTPTRTAKPPGGGLTVGDYRCLTLADATGRLTDDGFTRGTVTYTFSGGPVDATWLVDKQAPTPGEHRPAGAAIDLTLSSPFAVCPG